MVILKFASLLILEGFWNIPKLNEFLWEEDVAKIISIPLTGWWWS